MGTTESIFYQDDELTSSVPDGTLNHHAASTASSSTTRQRRRPMAGDEPRKPQRPPTLMRLSGLVLGMAQTGKQTLLQRLEGKDPYASRMDDDDDHDSEQLRSETLVPYQAPQRVWDRIQLHVRVSRTLPKDCPIDFCVVLINPRHDPNRVRDYLTETLKSLLTLLGYSETVEDDNNETHHNQKRPLCLCLLLNFRDLQESDDEGLQESDVKALTMEVLQECPALDASRLVLQCGSVSLRNCYGLQLLHHFIYQSYLQRKQSELEDFLQGVRKAQVDSRTAPMQTYEDFLAALQPDTTKESVVRRDRKTARRIDAEATSRTNQEDGEEWERRRQVAGEEPEKPQERSKGRRKIVQDHQKPLTPMSEKAKRKERKVSSSTKSEKPSALSSYIASKDALEAFLASEDEEDDVPLSRLSQKRAGGYDSDSDDDDEFYYDEAGQRHMHLSDSAGLQDEKLEKKDRHSFQKSEKGITQSSIQKLETDKSKPKKENQTSEAKVSSAAPSPKKENSDAAVQQAVAKTDLDARRETKSSATTDGMHGQGKGADASQKELVNGSRATSSAQDAVTETNGDQPSPEDAKPHSVQHELGDSRESESRKGSAFDDSPRPEARDVESVDEAQASPKQPDANRSQWGGSNSGEARSEVDQGEAPISSSSTRKQDESGGEGSVEYKKEASDKEKSSIPQHDSEGTDYEEVTEIRKSIDRPAGTGESDDGSKEHTSDMAANGASRGTAPEARQEEETQSSQQKPPGADTTALVKGGMLHSEDDGQNEEADAPKTTSAAATAVTDSSDNEPEDSHAVADTKGPSKLETPSEVKVEAAPVEKTGGLSEAAVAAIQAAQEEAERMLQQQELQETKEPKKKKKDDGDKKKKKKKEKKAKRSKAESSF